MIHIPKIHKTAKNIQNEQIISYWYNICGKSGAAICALTVQGSTQKAWLPRKGTVVLIKATVPKTGPSLMITQFRFSKSGQNKIKLFMSLSFHPDIMLSTCHLTVQAKFRKSAALPRVTVRRVSEVKLALVWAPSPAQLSFRPQMLTRFCLVSERGVDHRPLLTLQSAASVNVTQQSCHPYKAFKTFHVNLKTQFSKENKLLKM